MLYKAAKLGVGFFLFSRCVLFWHVLSESCDKVEGAILLACACGSGSEERVVVLGCHPGRWHRQTAQVVPICAVPWGWVVRTDPGRLDLLFTACPFPSERSAFPAGEKSWSTKHLLGIRVCCVALPVLRSQRVRLKPDRAVGAFPYPRSFTDNFPKSGRKLLLQQVLWWICVYSEFAQSADTSGFVVEFTVVQSLVLSSVWNSLTHRKSELEIGFYRVKKKIQYRNIKRNYPVQTPLYSGNCYSVP